MTTIMTIISLNRISNLQIISDQQTNCFANRTTNISGNSSIDTSLIRDIYCGREGLFETSVAMLFVDDYDDDDETNISKP